MIRFRKTIKFLEKNLSKESRILDLGVNNDLAELMRKNGYKVDNTSTDLDVDFKKLKKYKVVTAFEILEHLFAPFNLLNGTDGILIASVPLKVWFNTAHWDNKDKLNCHYHEFEKRQFDRLLERTGWTVINSEVWTRPDKLRFGIRPLLRYIFPSYYIVIARK